MIKHLSDLEKFKYDKNCKYCIQNGEEQINEKSNLKKNISRLKKDIKNLQNKLKKASKTYKEKKKSIDKLNKSLVEFNFKYNEKDNKYQDLKINLIIHSVLFRLKLLKKIYLDFYYCKKQF